MAECHPVGFQWVMEAKARGATVIHIDPRYTRTSAVADLHVPLRAGSDIVLLGGLINYVLSSGKFFRDYVVNYTNAATIIGEDFKDTEDLDGLFSGFDPDSRSYDPASWTYEGTEVQAASGERDAEYDDRTGSDESSSGRTRPSVRAGRARRGARLGRRARRHAAHRPDARAPAVRVPGTQAALRAVHRRRWWSRPAGYRGRAFRPDLRADHGEFRPGPDHRLGVQRRLDAAHRRRAVHPRRVDPAGAARQHRPAGRRHPGAARARLDPGVHRHPDAVRPAARVHPDAARAHQRGPRRFVAAEGTDKGFWANMRAYTVSLLKAYWGDAATAANDFCFDYLPRLTGSHSTYETVMAQLAGDCEGYFLLGENPAVGSANGKLQRLGMAKLKWLVVRDFSLIESATFWKDGPEIDSGELRTEDIGTEVFFMPAAAHTEKNGSFTNTQRMLQWHHAAVEPAGDARSELWFTYHLGRLIRSKLAGLHRRDGPAGARPHLGLPGRGRRWPSRPPRRCSPRSTAGTPTASRCPPTPSSRTTAPPPAAAGSTAACTPTGSTRPRAASPAGSRAGSRPSGAGPGRRTGASCTTAPPPTRTASRGASARPWCGGTPTRASGRGTMCPTSFRIRRPSYRPPQDATGPAAHAGTDPFIMQADGKAWLYAPAGLVDGPLPAHYEPQDSPLPNPLYAQQRNPARQVKAFAHPDNRFQPSDGSPGSAVFPYVATTYRLTEHHTAGGMSRWLPYLAELQPEFFCEVSPELAAERGLDHLGWATIVTARNAVEARVLVTPRIPPLTVQGRRLHQVGLPYHWGWAGYSTGDSANDLVEISLDPNVHIQETKAFACDIQAGPAAHRGGAARARPGVPGAGRDHRADGDGTMTAVDVQIGPRPDDRPDGMDSYPGEQPRMGFFTDTSVCIGCKACEVACKEWNRVPEDGLALTGMSYDNSVGLGADTWRHVAFIEQQRPVSVAGGDGADGGAAAGGSAAARTGTALADVVGRVQALHARRLPGRVPDRGADAHRVRHRGRAGGRLQRLRLLHPRLPVRGDRPAQGGRPGLEVHAVLRPARRGDGAGLRQGVPDRLDPVRAA